MREFEGVRLRAQGRFKNGVGTARPQALGNKRNSCGDEPSPPRSGCVLESSLGKAPLNGNSLSQFRLWTVR